MVDGHVVSCSALAPRVLESLLSRYGLDVVTVAAGEPLRGSYWGDPEAGLADDRLYVRPCTPVHSALHEACHYICMDPHRRAGLDTNAGGDYDEENAVCYLSVLLADWVEGFGSARMLEDMDAWGYTFRLGSARAWIECDAEEVAAWLRDEGLVDAWLEPTWRLRRTVSCAHGVCNE